MDVVVLQAIASSAKSNADPIAFKSKEILLKSDASFLEAIHEALLPDLFNFNETTSAIDQCLVFTGGSYQQRKNQLCQATQVICSISMLSEDYMQLVNNCMEMLNNFWMLKSVRAHHHFFVCFC